jgi:ribose transport system ATP-binding protein
MDHYLEMRNITKSFSDNVVLNGINFHANRGQVHALLGENGAGKSTLMKILAGLYPSEGGQIWLDGEAVTIQSTKQAQDLGIAMIYQETKLFQDLSIAENVFIGREPLKRWSRLIHWDMLYRETDRYISMLGLKLDPKAQVKSLNAAQQKFVEIMKALSFNAKIMIMDEPTAALSEQESMLLFEVIGHLKKMGVSIIYISHRLEEIKRIADQVTVIRDGGVMISCLMKEADFDDIVDLMVGKAFEDRYPKLRAKIGNELMRVEGLNYHNLLHNINFSVRSGEIVALTGLTGSGRRLLAKVLFGTEGPFEGKLHLQGKMFTKMDPNTARLNGLCFASGLYSEEGLISNSSISDNISLTNLERVTSSGFINSRLETTLMKNFISRLEISSGEKDLVGNLSGGKQKKVVLAKWLFANARILIFDEPTAGIDISSKSDIYNIMNEMVMSGASVIMISSDLSEILGMADRILVMHKGSIVKQLLRGNATKEKLLYYASGGTLEDET